MAAPVAFNLTVVGLSIHNADLDTLERHDVSVERRNFIVRGLVKSSGVAGAFLLSTCNRKELYLQHDATVDVKKVLSQAKFFQPGCSPFINTGLPAYRRFSVK